MAARKKKEVTAEDLERGLAEVERREKALADAEKWPRGRSVWDRLLEEEPEEIPKP